jgi:AAA domain
VANINFGIWDVPVLDRFARGYPEHPSENNTHTPTFYARLTDALTTTFEWDAHFAAYSCPEIPRRLATHGAFAHAPTMRFFVVDVDGPDHQATDEWWSSEAPKLQKLADDRRPYYAYRTKGGYRIIYGLTKGFVIDSPAKAKQWSDSYKSWLTILENDYQITGDKACSDWSRLYRLPNVRRDGVDVTPANTLGEPDHIFGWNAPYAPEVADLQRSRIRTQGNNLWLGEHDLAPTPTIALPSSSPAFTDEELDRAGRQLAAIWPARGRHLASLALCGALAQAGWQEATIAGFVGFVSGVSGGEVDLNKRTKQARDSISKISRGEPVSGWLQLEDHVADKAKLLDARRVIRQGPAIDLFSVAIRNANPTPGERLIAATAAARDLLPGEPGADFVELLDLAAHMLHEELGSKEEPAPLKPEPMGFTFRELAKRDTPPIKWLAKNLLTVGGVSAISAEPKSAKSWCATKLGISLASGKAVFGRHEVPSPCDVFYFYAEDPEASVKTRGLAIAKGLGLTPDDPWALRFHAQPRGRSLDVSDTAQLAVFVASCMRAGKGIKLAILDPLSDIHSGEEDKRDSMAPIMHRLRVAARVLGTWANGDPDSVGILFVHHSAKQTSDSKSRRKGQTMRGSSAIHGAVDNGIYLYELTGNGQNEFISGLYSETRSARGGGVYTIKVTLEDDPKTGAAHTATFSTEERSSEKEKKKADISEDSTYSLVKILFEFGAPVTSDILRRKLGLGKDGTEEAIERACSEGLAEKHIHGKKVAGYKITENGKNLIRGAPVTKPEPSSDMKDKLGKALGF